MKRKLLPSLVALFLALSANGIAAESDSQEVAQILNPSLEIPVEEVLPIEEGLSAQEFYSYMQEAIDDEDWWAAIDYGEIVLYHFPDSPFCQEIPYLMGMNYFRLEQHELANEMLSEYLKGSTSPKYFEEAVETKFAIAECWRQGGKKRLFGSHKMPAIVPAYEDALEIYDEVLTTLPHHEIAVRAFLGKAEIQAYLGDFQPSIETLQVLIRRFPKHDLAAESYLRINQTYVKQCTEESLNPDLLDLAEVNLRKFRLAFPREPRLAESEKLLADMQEIFASNLFDTGNFFERTKKIPASIIYYNKVVASFPKTEAAAASREKLEILQPSDQL